MPGAGGPHDDQGEKGAIIDLALKILRLCQPGGALKEKVHRFLGGGGVDEIQLLRGQRRPAEMGQDLVVEGLIGAPGINQDPVTVVND